MSTGDMMSRAAVMTRAAEVQRAFNDYLVRVGPALIEWREARQAIFDMPPPEKGAPVGAMAPLFARLADAENALMAVAREIVR